MKKALTAATLTLATLFAGTALADDKAKTADSCVLNNLATLVNQLDEKDLGGVSITLGMDVLDGLTKHCEEYTDSQAKIFKGMNSFSYKNDKVSLTFSKP